MRPSLLLLAGLAALSLPASAQAATIDGDINTLASITVGLGSEWGVTMANGVASGPNTPTDRVGSTYASVAAYSAAGVTRMIEDTNDTRNDYTLGPNSGGQNFDAEFLGATIQGTGPARKLFLGIMSGQRADNAFANFEPGDIRITTAFGREFGIEVGGGAGSGAGTSALITEGGSGSFYTINTSGIVQSHSADASHLVGGLYESPTWFIESVGGLPNTRTQLQMTGGGAFRGLTDYAFRWDAGSVHSVIEVGVNMSSFLLAQGDSISGVFWQPSCGNDLLNISGVGNSTLVPEPATLAFVGLGAVSLVVRRSRRRSR